MYSNAIIDIFLNSGTQVGIPRYKSEFQDKSQNSELQVGIPRHKSEFKVEISICKSEFRNTSRKFKLENSIYISKFLFVS